MYVCLCNSVTDRAIKRAVDQGHDTFEKIQHQLKVATCCGCCQSHAKEVIAEVKAEQKIGTVPLNVVAMPMFCTV